MKITEFRDKRGRRILTCAIISTRFLSVLSSVWKNEGLFQNSWENLVAGWCVEYYKQYGKAPKKNIEGIYKNWEEKNSDSNTSEIIQRFLSGLSEDFEETNGKINSKYEIEQAKPYFLENETRSLIQKLQGAIDTKKHDNIEQHIQSFRVPNLGTDSDDIHLFNDSKAWSCMFADKEDLLIKYPGELGKFFGNELARGNFISLLAPEKRGKCVSEGMQVLLADGRVKTIGWIVKHKTKTPIISLNEKTQRFEPVIVSDFWENGVKECFELKTKSGRRVVTTGNHKHLTPDGWEYLQDIKPGDFIAVPKKLEFFGKTRVKDEELKYLAYMLAEGCCLDQCTFTNTDDILVQDFKECCEKLGMICRERDGVSYKGSVEIRNKYPEVLHSVSSKTKRIPEAVFRCPKDQIAMFLRVFFSCVGYVNPEGSSIEIGLANKHMVRQIGHLLTRFGIVYSFSYKSTSYINKKYGEKRRFKSWKIMIRSQEYVNKFLEEINFVSYKTRVPKELKKSKSFLDKLPWQVCQKFVNNLQEEFPDPVPANKKGYRWKLGYFVRNRYKVLGAIRDQIHAKLPMMRQSFVSMKGTNTYDKYLSSDVLWDEVKSIRSVGNKITYDLTVPEHHNFVCNDCIVHNTMVLLDIAFQGILNRRRVAFFEVGDMTRKQISKRFAIRVCERPWTPQEVKIPTRIIVNKGNPDVDFKTIVFKDYLQVKMVEEGFAKIRNKIKSERTLFKMRVYPANSFSIQHLRNTIEYWARDGWAADVVVVDYADIMAPSLGIKDPRERINDIWIGLRALSQSMNCLVVTATQANRASYNVRNIRMEHVSEDKRKLAHPTGILALDQVDDEYQKQVLRYRWVNLREEARGSEIYVAGCFALANPAMISCFESYKVKTIGTETKPEE